MEDASYGINYCATAWAIQSLSHGMPSLLLPLALVSHPPLRIRCLVGWQDKRVEHVAPPGGSCQAYSSTRSPALHCVEDNCPFYATLDDQESELHRGLLCHSETPTSSQKIIVQKETLWSFLSLFEDLAHDPTCLHRDSDRNLDLLENVLGEICKANLRNVITTW